MGITQSIGASSLIRPGVIDNTAARPASPYEGQVIFQKDTDQLLVWNGTAWVIPNSPAQNPMGLEFITGGTQSGSAALNVDGVFTSTYLNYRLEITAVQQSVANNAVRFNFRSGGSTNSNNTYEYAYRGLRTNGTSGDTSFATTFAEIGIYMATYANTLLGSAAIDIQGPQAAQTSFGLVNAIGYEGGVYQMRNGGFVYNDLTSFDGFRLSLSGSGNIAFQWQVYGYRK